jgi:hypothetical protein
MSASSGVGWRRITFWNLSGFSSMIVVRSLGSIAFIAAIAAGHPLGSFMKHHPSAQDTVQCDLSMILPWLPDENIA